MDDFDLIFIQSILKNLIKYFRGEDVSSFQPPYDLIIASDGILLQPI